MQIPSGLVAFILAFALAAFGEAIMRTCAVHACPWPL
jgi:hypothetical protein